MSLYRKKETISISSDKSFLWNAGLCLKAIENSSLLIPFGIFPEDLPIEKTMIVSKGDPIVVFNTKDNRILSITVKLEKNMIIKLMKNCEIHLIPDNDKKTEVREFYIIEGIVNPYYFQ